MFNPSEMEKLITPVSGIIDELKLIDDFLAITMSEDGEEAQARGNELATYMARTGKLLADAKYFLNERMKDEVMDTLRENASKAGASHTAINAIIKSLCKKEQFLVDWAERSNRSCTHQLDWCRTVISKSKEEMRLAGMQRT